MPSTLHWIEDAEAQRFRELASHQRGGFEPPIVVTGKPPAAIGRRSFLVVLQRLFAVGEEQRHPERWDDVV